MSPTDRERVLAERRAQGLPERITDPAILARLAALLVLKANRKRQERAA